MHEQGVKLVVDGEFDGVDGVSQTMGADTVIQATRREYTRDQPRPSTSNTIRIPLRSSFDDSNPSLDTLSPRLSPPLVPSDYLLQLCPGSHPVISLRRSFQSMSDQGRTVDRHRRW